MWKLHWFLRDFGYDSDLLSRDEVDEHLMVGLEGTARLVHETKAGRIRAELVGFAPASVSSGDGSDDLHHGSGGRIA